MSGCTEYSILANAVALKEERSYYKDSQRDLRMRKWENICVGVHLRADRLTDVHYSVVRGIKFGCLIYAPGWASIVLHWVNRSCTNCQYITFKLDMIPNEIA